MGTEDLIRKYQAITIEGEEEDTITFMGSMKEKGVQIVAGCLVGKILLTTGIPRDGLQTARQKAWRTVRESLGNNIIVFIILVESDKRRVLAGGPWHSDRALIVLQEPSGKWYW